MEEKHDSENGIIDITNLNTTVYFFISHVSKGITEWFLSNVILQQQLLLLVFDSQDKNFTNSVRRYQFLRFCYVY